MVEEVEVEVDGVRRDTTLLRLLLEEFATPGRKELAGRSSGERFDAATFVLALSITQLGSVGFDARRKSGARKREKSDAGLMAFCGGGEEKLARKTNQAERKSSQRSKTF